MNEQQHWHAITVFWISTGLIVVQTVIFAAALWRFW